MGITENLSSEAYLASGRESRNLPEHELLGILDAMQLTVFSEQRREPDSLILFVQAPNGTGGEIILSPSGGVFLGFGLGGSDLLKIAEWMSDHSETPIWYWTSNGNEAFRVDAGTFLSLLDKARHGGVGHPHGTPWDQPDDK